MDSSLLKLINPSFQIEWDGKAYDVKKANLEKVALFQKKAMELATSGSADTDVNLIAYALFLILKDVIPTITEEEILQKAPGNLDFNTIADSLGFLKATVTPPAQEKIQEVQSTTESSSSTSQTEPAGPQETSAS